MAVELILPAAFGGLQLEQKELSMTREQGVSNSLQDASVCSQIVSSCMLLRRALIFLLKLGSLVVLSTRTLLRRSLFIVA